MVHSISLHRFRSASTSTREREGFAYSFEIDVLAVTGSVWHAASTAF
jgi:hypothetical protein